MLIIFKTNSSITDSKVSKGFPAKEVSGQAVGFGGRKQILMVRIFLYLFFGEVIRKDIREVVRVKR